MRQILKKAISLFVVAVFVLSLVPVISFADSATHPGMRDDATALYTGATKPGYQRFEAVSNEYIGGKGEAYSLYGDMNGAQYREPYTTGLLSTPSEQDVFEFSAYIPSDSDGFSLEISVYGLTVENNPSYLTFNPDALSIKWGENISCDMENKWVNFAFVSPEPYSASDAQHDSRIKIYINGILQKVTIGSVNSVAGFRHIRFTPIAGNSNLDPVAYIDNVRLYTGEYNSQYDIVDEISYVNGIEDGTILVAGQKSVGEFKAEITKKEDTIIRVYETETSTQPLPDDAVVKEGYMVVAAAKNGADHERSYNYYTTGKYVKEYPDMRADADSLHPALSRASEQRYVVIGDEYLGGKGEPYALYADSAAAPTRGPYNVFPTQTGYEKDVVEFAAYFPSGSNGLTLKVDVFGLATDAHLNTPLLLKDDGIYTNWSTGPSKFHSLQPDRWYNFAFVSPEPYNEDDETHDSKVELYVNGVLVHEINSVQSTTGYRAFDFGPIGAWGNFGPIAYIDNVRYHNDDYEPQYDALDEISYKDGIDENNNITVKGNITVAEFKKGISAKEDTIIRVYETETSTQPLPDSAIVEDGYMVVAAAKNGSEMERSYNYYTVARAEKEIIVSTKVNDAEAKLYDADDTLSVQADFHNYTSSKTFNAKMYVAQYIGSELIGIWATESKTVNPNTKETFTCNFEDIKDLKNSNIKVMLLDNNLTPYVKPVTMRYNESGTVATLHLIGDSIVQTYEDKSYPIQGWGNFIGNYLNTNITVSNHARAGWTSDHYLYPNGIYTKENGVRDYGTQTENIAGAADIDYTWASVKPTVNTGDYVMIALGINDKSHMSEEAYRENINVLCQEAADIGANVILLTPTIVGNDWNSISAFDKWYYAVMGDICEDIAAERGLVCLDLESELIETYNNMVAEYKKENQNATDTEAYNYVRNYFHLYGASSTNPPAGWDNFGTLEGDDKMHYNLVGANKVASIIAELLRESGSPLGDYVVIPQ